VLDARYEKYEDSNAVKSFCDCISGEESVDVASEALCKRAADSSGHVTGDELVELKRVLKDLEETDPDECCYIILGGAKSSHSYSVISIFTAYAVSHLRAG
jgi:hypothetical protein